MKFPISIKDETGHDLGWYFCDADGKEIDPEEIVRVLNAHEEARLAAYEAGKDLMSQVMWPE